MKKGLELYLQCDCNIDLHSEYNDSQAVACFFTSTLYTVVGLCSDIQAWRTYLYTLLLNT